MASSRRRRGDSKPTRNEAKFGVVRQGTRPKSPSLVGETDRCATAAAALRAAAALLRRDDAATRRRSHRPNAADRETHNRIYRFSALHFAATHNASIWCIFDENCRQRPAIHGGLCIEIRLPGESG